MTPRAAGSKTTAKQLTDTPGWLGQFVAIIRQIQRGYEPAVKSKTGQVRRTSKVKQPLIVRRHRPDYLIPLFLLIIMLTGLILIYSISPQRANAQNNLLGDTIYGQNYYFVRHLVSAFLAACTFLIFSLVPMAWFRRFVGWILAAGFIGAAFLFLLSRTSPDLVCSLGACRWLRFGPISIQVAELLKFCLLVFFSFFWAFFVRRGQINHHLNLVSSLIISGLALFSVVVLQNDLGSGVALLAVLLAMVLMAGIKVRYLALVAVLIVVLGAAMVIAKPHRASRVTTFFTDSTTPIDEVEINDQNRHIIQAKIAVGSGGLLGLGVGKSVQATGYLPEAINDSIFAIIGEVFGFVGTGLVLSLYLVLLYRLLVGLAYSHQPLNQLWFAGTFAWIFAHVVINIGSMIGLMPMTGITLPFLSYGGSSMLFVAAALGVAFNLSRYTAHTPVTELKYG